MGLFEFVMILASVVIGLGVTEILTGWANLLRARTAVRFYWIHVLLQVGVFFALLQQWWEFWDFAEVGEISFLAVLTVLAPSIVLYLIAHLLFPTRATDADLEAYYFEQSPVLWGLAIASALVGTFLPPLVFGYAVLHPANVAGLPIIAMSGVLAASKSRRVHAVLAPLVVLVLILDTVLANPAITAG